MSLNDMVTMDSENGKWILIKGKLVSDDFVQGSRFF